MMSLTFGLFTQVSGSGPLGPLVHVNPVPSIKGQGHSLTLAKGHSDFNIQFCFLRNCWVI